MGKGLRRMGLDVGHDTPRAEGGEWQRPPVNRPRTDPTGASIGPELGCRGGPGQGQDTIAHEAGGLAKLVVVSTKPAFKTEVADIAM